MPALRERHTWILSPRPIGAISNAAGCSVRAIRHYHACGAVPEPARSSNGYRDYRLGDLVAVLRVRSLIAAGIPLQEIESGSQDELYDRALERINDQIDKLHAQRKQLLSLQHDGEGMPADLHDQLSDLLGNDEVAYAEIEAWELMAFTGVATAATWCQLRTNLKIPEHRAETWQAKNLWTQLGRTPTKHAATLIEEWKHLHNRGVMTGVMETLQPGSVNLMLADIPAVGAQKLAIESLVDPS